MTAKSKFLVALIAGLLFAVSGTVSAQNPDLSQNPAPSPDVQSQGQMQPPQDQGPQDRIQMQEQGQDQDQDVMQDDVMQDQGQDQGPANPPTLGPRNDQQSPSDNDRPPMSELPPKPSPNVGPNGANPAYGRPNYNGPGAGPNYGGPNGGPPPNYGGPGYGNSSSGNRNNNNETSENNGVGRVSLTHGDVSTQRGDSGDWSAAQLNAPLMTGDKVSTGDKARAEVQLDYANILRLSEHTQANVTNLTRKTIQIQVGHGMANYTVLGNSDADAEIDTPNVAIRTERRASSFRILVTADDHTEVLVRHGEIEITTPQGGTRVGENQFITIRGTGADTQYRIGEAPARDDWDQWNTDRDKMIRGSVGRSHTNDYYTGTQDLDGNGNWQNVPDYGSAWFPNVDQGWAPYSAGNWVWEPYWGWTWVAAESWGWAPYHYGRWFQYNGAWGWWPGPVYGAPYYRPLWAPAYVSFFGYGGGFGFGAGFGWGSIGWFPIGPCDFFHPWWGGWGGRFGHTGFRGWERGGFAPLHGGSRFSNVRLAQNDPHFRGATGVSADHFGGHGGTFSRVNHASLQNAHFATGNLPVTPTRGSLSASGRPAAAGTVRNGGGSQRFFSTRGTTTAGASGRSFEREQAQVSNSMRQNGISPMNQRAGENRNAVGAGMGNRGGNPQSNARMSQPGFNQSGRGNEGIGSRSTGEARGNSNPGAESRAGNSIGSSGREGGGANGGWQKFTPMAPRSSSESGRAESGRTESGRPSSGMGTENRGPQNRGSYGSPRGYSGSEGRSPAGRAPEGRGYSQSRPPLNMRQPIATPRSYGNPYGGRGGYPGYGGRTPSYGGGRAPSSGGGRAPSFGGGHSAPSSHGGGGGGSSHGGGGGGSHGGGGGHGGHR